MLFEFGLFELKVKIEAKITEQKSADEDNLCHTHFAC